MEKHIAHIPELCVLLRNINIYTEDYLEKLRKFFFSFSYFLNYCKNIYCTYSMVL